MAGEREVLREIPTGSDHQPLLAEVQKALTHLHRAHEFALDVQLDIWQFAEPLRNLAAMGVQEPALRWLVVKGYAEHAHELTTFSEADRRFRPSSNVSFGPKTCFVITEAGAEFMQDQQEEASLAAPILRFPTQTAATAPMPRWDRQTRTLYFGDQIVKRFREPAANQEAVLSTFEEQDWTQVIEDPLPPVGVESSPEMRLRNTIRRLNANQVNPLLHFRGDGSGFRILWEVVEQVTLPLEAARRKARRAA